MYDLSQQRQTIAQRLREDLIGPRENEERLFSRPSDTYLTGMLWPPSTRMSPEDDEKIATASASKGDSGSSDEDDAVSNSSVQKPSVMGLSFSAKGAGKLRVDITARFATYERVETEDGATAWQRTPFEFLFKDVDLNSGSRTIKHGGVESDASSFDVHLRSVPLGAGVLVTVSLINAALLSDDASRNDLESATLFQTSLEVKPLQGTELVPKPARHSELGNAELSDEDQRSNQLLFRNEHIFSVGHVCSASWGPTSAGSDSALKTEHVRTEWIPSAIVPGVRAEGHPIFDKLGDGSLGWDCLSASVLASASPDSLSEILTSLADCYAEWLEGQKLEANGLSEEWQEAAELNLRECGIVLERFRSAAREISGDERLRRAFQLANLAMDVQYRWARPDEGGLRWRPFQLAFLLLSGPSSALRDHEHRSIMDLLWFPTGGGKTEAYLALIAMVAFHRRLSDDSADQAGVAALMRYTLRLLTTQQFARSAAMVLACEAIRIGTIESPVGLPLRGDLPFSIGLWVGGEATPNRRSAAVNSLAGGAEGPSPKQLALCPCCRETLIWERGARDTPIQPECRTNGCSLRGKLPVFTVDDDIYDVRPTLVVGTIDKFAQIVRSPDTNRLFSIQDGSPPDLILQDELHLISGPLGTIAGLYEAAIDLMFSTKGHCPKIVGSTATIRRAREQVRALFDRTACQFPPPALNQSDSGFSVVDSDSSGRRYVGVSTAGRSAKFTLQAVAGSLLQSAAAAFSEDSERDPYSTLLGYFNSLRELGGALVLMQDDVNDSISILAKARDESPRAVHRVEELTSRRTQAEILNMLGDLEIRAGASGQVDTVLATNMVSVGVDIPRLGLMLVNGQPKTTAEYIQSTSRVGRGAVSGLVVTLLNNAKARDRSHFETFVGVHGALYRNVEATSVTPFASRARDRALHASLVAVVRHIIPGMLDNPLEIDRHETEARALIERLAKRAQRIDSSENDVRGELHELLDTWIARSPRAYWNDFRPSDSLLMSAEVAARNRSLGRADRAAWSTLNSMRNVEAGTPFRMARRLRGGDAGEQ